MAVALMLPTSPMEFFSTEGLATIAGAGSGVIAGEFMGTLFTTVSGVTGYAALAVKFVGQLAMSGILFFLGSKFRGMPQSFLYLAGAVAPAGILADLLAKMTAKTATTYAQVGAISLRRYFPQRPMIQGRAGEVIRGFGSGQVIYNKTQTGQVLYSKTTG